MHPFVETVSVAGAVVGVIVVAIIVLTLFFRGLSWISAAGSKPETIAVRGVLKKDTLATVHLAGGETFERVRFVGFTNSETLKTRLPYELNGMVILEDEKQHRYLVRAKNIRMIVVAPEAESA
jgi:hypothetical protein